MYREIFLVLSLFNLLVIANAQESSYKFGHFAHPLGEAVWFNNKAIVPILQRDRDYTSQKLYLLRFDIKGVLHDTITPGNDSSDAYMVGVNLLETLNQGQLAVGFSSGDLNGDMVYAAIEVYDTSFTKLDRFPGNQYPISAIGAMVDRGNERVIGSYVSDSTINGSFLVKYRNSVVVDSLKLPSHGSNWVEAGAYFSGHYVFGHSRLGDEYLTIVAEDFSTDTTYSRGWHSDNYNKNVFDFIVSDNYKYLYALAIFDYQSFAIMKYDQDFNLLGIDSSQSQWTRRTNEYMVSKAKFCDYRTPDSIFMVGGKLPKNDGYFHLWDTSYKSPLQVVLCDTAGNFYWNRSVGDSNNAYYYPWTITATPDGGALIFSGKYDHTFDKDPHFLLSAIKIQGNGDVLSEKEYPLISGLPLKVYPNPVGDNINYELPNGETARHYQIYNLQAKLIASGSELEKFDVEALSAGHYFLQIEDVKGRKYLGRFIKK